MVYVLLSVKSNVEYHQQTSVAGWERFRPHVTHRLRNIPYPREQHMNPKCCSALHTIRCAAGVPSRAPRPLPPAGQHLEAANVGGMRMVLTCGSPDKVIVGIRILTGSSGPSYAPKEVRAC